MLLKPSLHLKFTAQHVLCHQMLWMVEQRISCTVIGWSNKGLLLLAVDSHTHPDTDPDVQTLPRPRHTHTHLLTLKHTLIHSHTHKTHAQTHTHTHLLTLTHTLIHSHTQTHTHSPFEGGWSKLPIRKLKGQGMPVPLTESRGGGELVPI